MSHSTDSTELVALVEELVEAHLDTIEIGSGVDRDWGDHVDYLQALVRESHSMLAVATA